MSEQFSLTAQAPQPSQTEREALDTYDTPEPLARAVCWALRPEMGSFSYPERILEPSAGTGVFIHAARQVWPKATIAGIDIAPRGPEVLKADFFELPRREEYDLVIGNPPWSLAQEFVEHSLRVVRNLGVVAFILRTSFWHGQQRVDGLHRPHPPRFWLPLRERPSYTGDGKSDSVDSSVFVWQKGFSGRTEVLPHLHWRGGRG